MWNLKEQPNSIEAEQSVLWCMLIDSTTVPLVLSWITEDHFYNSNNKIIFRSIYNLSKKWKKIDMITVVEDLQWQENIIKLNNGKEIVDKYKKNNLLEEVWWRMFIVELTEIVPTTSNINEYISIVKEKYILRKILNLWLSISYWIESNLWSIDIKSDIEKKLRIINWMDISDTTYKLDNIIDRKYQRILDNMENDIQLSRYIKTWLKALDDTIIWLWEWDLIIVAASTSVWKTFTSTNLINEPLKKWKKVLFFSTETKDESIVDILTSIRSNYSYKNLQLLDKKLIELKEKKLIWLWRIEQWIDKDDSNIKILDKLIEKEKYIIQNNISDITEQIWSLYEEDILINDVTWISVDQIKNKIISESVIKKVDIVVIDQLSKIKWEWKTVTDRFAKISWELKQLARELNISIILNVQLLSKDIERRPWHEPMMADIKSASDISEDADKVLLLNRPLHWATKDWTVNEFTDKTMHINIAKNRGGNTKKIVLWCDIAYQRLRDATEQEINSANIFDN